MTYLRALQLLINGYKKVKGRMPEGLDLLKIKQEARQKVINAKKIINVDFSKGRKFYEEGIGDLIQKGKLFVGKAPKTKKIKEAVDPKLVQQESIKDMYKRLMRSNKEAIKNFKNRNKPRDDKATGGLANLSQTYDNNPTLQSQFPNKQDYLDLFSSTTTTTPQTQTYAQMTQQSPAGIPAVKPIVPIIPLGQEGDGGGGGGITKVRPNRFDYGYTTLSEDLVQGESPIGGYRTPGTEANIDFLANIGEGTIADEDYDKIEELKDTYYGAKAGLGNFYKKVSPFLKIKGGFEKAADFTKGVADKIRKAKEARELRAALKIAQAEINRMGYQDYGSGGGLDPSLNDPVTGEYTGASKQDYGSGE